MFKQIWLLPIALLFCATLIAIPLSVYTAWIMDGKYKPWRIFTWIEARLNSGPQNWRQYAGSLLLFNTFMFTFGYLVLILQPWTPLNPTHKSLLYPSTIFHSVVSFMTNTDLQHYSGEIHLSNFSQIFFGIFNLFTSAAIGLSALCAIIRGLRGDEYLGNFFVDVWRCAVYLFLPIAIILAIIFLQQGSPMSLHSLHPVTTLEGRTQNIVVGPVAAFESIKMLGTNGGGFYSMNSAHPFENPTALTNFFNTLAMMLFPFTLVLMYGRMLQRLSHARVIFSVMLIMMAGTIIWTVHFDTEKPNPALTSHPARIYPQMQIPAVAMLPVDQHNGNLEGKELRFGVSAGATFAALTTDVTCGAVNAEADSLNPLAALAPFAGMWLNCLFGGKGVGMINMLIFIIIAIFIAGQMVGRSPEYLGKKIGASEVKLAIIALLVHPFMILIPTGFFAATHWGSEAISNPGPHGFSQILYQFSSSSANNGSAFDGLKVTSGFYNPHQAFTTEAAWDIASGMVIVLSRFLPIIAPIAMAARLGAKKTSPLSSGTLRDDTLVFGCLLLGAILIIGALLFLPVAALGPLAEHLGPIPF